MKKITSNGVYSRAEVYDVLFGWDRSAEFLFVDSVFQLHGLNPGDRLLELACGTGVCSLHLEVLGWVMEGLDLSTSMVEAFNRRAREQGRGMVGHEGDMTNFRLKKSFDGAYCPLGSIGLLSDDRSMLGHFNAVGKAVRPGGLYLVDLGLNPNGTAPLDLDEVNWLMEGKSWNVHAVGGKVLLEDSDGKILEELEWEGVPLEFESSHFFRLIKESEVWEVVASYPEAEFSEEGISLFDPSIEGLNGDEDRAMILLKRKEFSYGK